MIEALSGGREQPLSEVFAHGHSIHAFTSRPVDDATLKTIHELSKWGPTSFNSQPARFHFVRPGAARERLVGTLSSSNRDKTARAPMTVIVAYSQRFYEELPPGVLSEDALRMFRGNPALVQETALRNSSLQGAYFLLAARSLGLAVGPMSGFNPAAVNQAFFPDGGHAVNFLMNLGYPDPQFHRDRGPRFDFDDVATIE